MSSSFGVVEKHKYLWSTIIEFEAFSIMQTVNPIKDEDIISSSCNFIMS